MPSSNPPPIALSSLSIHDFRGIEQLDLDFRDPTGSPNRLVVLGGPNGSGKTAVLEAALIALGGSDLAVGPTDDRDIRKGSKGWAIKAVITHYSKDGFRKDVPVLKASGPSAGRIHPTAPHWYFSSWRTPSLVGSVNVTVGKQGRRPDKTERNRLLNVKLQLVNAAAVERFAGASRPSSGNYSRWITGINESWKTFYPDLGGEFAVDLVDSASDNEGSFDVFCKRKGAAMLSVDDLSAGQLELFLFLASLVLNDDREGIVFIDEPELHLDPQWHAPIVRTLMDRQPRAQFIVATHSPEIYAAAMSYERHFLVPEDDPRAQAWPRVGAMAEA